MAKRAFTDELRDGEQILFELKTNARIPKRKGRGHDKQPGTLYVTNKRIVHVNTGLFGMGATRYQVPMSQVVAATTETGTIFTQLRVEQAGGKSVQFLMTADDARQVEDIITDAQLSA